MNDVSICVKPLELWALYRAVLEGKFASDPVDEHVAGSPTVARLLMRVRSLLAQAQDADPRFLPSMDFSSEVPVKVGGVYWERSVAAAARCSSWLDASPVDRRALSRSFVAPYVLGDDLAGQFEDAVWAIAEP